MAHPSHGEQYVMGHTMVTMVTGPIHDFRNLQAPGTSEGSNRIRPIHGGKPSHVRQFGLLVVDPGLGFKKLQLRDAARWMYGEYI
jgi:hypothetical protein